MILFLTALLQLNGQEGRGPIKAFFNFNFLSKIKEDQHSLIICLCHHFPNVITEILKRSEKSVFLIMSRAYMQTGTIPLLWRQSITESIFGYQLLV